MSLICYLDVQAYEKKTTPHWIYDLGRKRNFAQVSLYWIFSFYITLFSHCIVIMHQHITLLLHVNEDASSWDIHDSFCLICITKHCEIVVIQDLMWHTSETIGDGLIKWNCLRWINAKCLTYPSSRSCKSYWLELHKFWV